MLSEATGREQFAFFIIQTNLRIYVARPAGKIDLPLLVSSCSRLPVDNKKVFNVIPAKNQLGLIEKRGVECFEN